MEALLQSYTFWWLVLLSTAAIIVSALLSLQVRRIRDLKEAYQRDSYAIWGGNGGKGPGACPGDGSGRTFHSAGDWNKPEAGEPATIEVWGGGDDTSSWAGGGGDTWRR